MTMPAGSEVYSVDCAPVQARGRQINDDDLSMAIDGPVSSLLRDDVGKQELEDLLVGVAETDFQADGVRQVLHNDRAPEDCRVGEAFAEAYVCAHCGCMFPWPTSRDQKNPNASMPGTDLVGFQDTGDAVRPMRFAFGEVKTSSEAKYPPSLVYGRHGLAVPLSQLKPARDTDAQTKLAVEDWHYWVGMGYEF